MYCNAGGASGTRDILGRSWKAPEAAASDTEQEERRITCGAPIGTGDDAILSLPQHAATTATAPMPAPIRLSPATQFQAEAAQAAAVSWSIGRHVEHPKTGATNAGLPHHQPGPTARRKRQRAAPPIPTAVAEAQTPGSRPAPRPDRIRSTAVEVRRQQHLLSLSALNYSSVLTALESCGDFIKSSSSEYNVCSLRIPMLRNEARASRWGPLRWCSELVQC